MNDQLAALRLFVRVARTGSFSRAARELATTQPTASRTIAALEKTLGAALFTRSTRALTLTEAGARYLERVEPLLAALEEADQERWAPASCAACCAWACRRRWRCAR